MVMMPPQHESPDSKPGQAVETPDSLLSFDRLRMTIGAYNTISTYNPDSKRGQGETLNSLLSFDRLRMTVGVYALAGFPPPKH